MIKKQVPDLQFVDTHARGANKSGFGYPIKPDISVYSMPPGDHEHSIDYCDLTTLDLHIEFKWASSHDPFEKPKWVKSSRSSSGGGGPCINSTDYAKDMLGQIGSYVAAQLSVQYRTHIFSIFII
jgi:hypothetical protein